MFSLKLNVIVMKDNGSTLFVRSHWASLLNLFSLVALLFVAVALIYNWWTLYVRCVQPTKAREAIQSRPLLLSAVGRVIRHSGQTILRLTSVHGQSTLAQELLTGVSLFLSGLKNAAEQLSAQDCWQRIWDRILAPFLLPQGALPAPT
jgi:hypothetical protein